MTDDKKPQLTGTGMALLAEEEDHQLRMYKDYEAALLDALTWGYGFLKIDGDGRVKYASIDEVYNNADFVRRNRPDTQQPGDKDA